MTVHPPKVWERGVTRTCLGKAKVKWTSLFPVVLELPVVPVSVCNI